MSSYEVSFYTRDELTFGRDDDGNFTVTVNKGAEPDTIKVVDNDKGGEDTFSGSSKAGPTEQQAYGEAEGITFEGEPIQPLAALPGQGDSDQQVIAVGIGDPVQTVVYSFTYTPVPGETVSFDYDSYISEPSYSAKDLYVEGQSTDKDPEEEHKDDEDTSSSSAEADSSSPSSSASGTSKASGGGSGPSKASGTSGPSGSGPSSPPCFTRGTAIRTARGEVLVEDLVVGDSVWTEAHGHQPVRWIFQREVAAKGAFSPIRICKGALGADRDILVSPAHRMLVSDPAIQLLFGFSKTLVAAKYLTNDCSIYRETTLETIEYFHILFDRHEVLEAHGTLSESFYPHCETIEGFSPEQREELIALFPEMQVDSPWFAIAYPALCAHELAIARRGLG